MTDLVEFLRARLDEDEQAAQACSRPHWEVSGPPTGHYAHSSTSDDLVGAWERHATSWSILADATMHTGRSLHHIARHDPARVLREVEAKRQIISEYERYAAERRRAMNGWDNSEPSPIITALAAVYADHPDYREEWKP